MQVLKTEHNSQRGSVFALLCGVVVIFAIVNIDKVVAVILIIVTLCGQSNRKSFCAQLFKLPAWFISYVHYYFTVVDFYAVS